MEKTETKFNKFVRKNITNSLVLRIIDLGLIPIAIPLLITRYVFKIKFFRVSGGRIGPLALNNEVFLRKLQLGIEKENKTRYIGIAHTSVCNNQLIKMLKRKMTIIQIPQPRFVRAITKIMASKSILSKWGLFITTPFELRSFPQFNETNPSLSFTDAEEEKGKELLKEMGVNNNWFICFHARDPVYVGQHLKRGDSRFTYRNCSIENYTKAAEYITKQGGYALRMGAKVETKLSELDNRKIIDYATKHRTEFGDIYLSARCKFFLGVHTGLESVSQIFNTPGAMANHTPLTPLTPFCDVQYFPPGKKDLFIPKKIWSIKKKRFLTFKEIIEFEMNKFSYEAEDYKKEGLVPVENTSKEILDLAMEMNERLDGTWKTTKEDEELQHKFKSLFKQGPKEYPFSVRIGAKFLRENKHLLD
ncbi:MAG: TIGR04372 family glycosyltransferase [Nanoarchaeota archaeon]